MSRYCDKSKIIYSLGKRPEITLRIEGDATFYDGSKEKYLYIGTIRSQDTWKNSTLISIDIDAKDTITIQAVLKFESPGGLFGGGGEEQVETSLTVLIKEVGGSRIKELEDENAFTCRTRGM